jgi:hypothetical protein
MPWEAVYCPRGHKLDPDAWPAGETPMITQRCTHKEPQMTGICGSCVYWLQCGEFKIMVDLTASEAYELAKPGRALEEILAFAGLRTWARPVKSNRSTRSNAYRPPNPATTSV